ncbi:MAG TPA: TPM domain-containing protein, partial [Candidatus Thermoplasmatota archaeon]|nr:TPM domain-containing protein [Candidatus Thermoplasmatota archaeon]
MPRLLPVALAFALLLAAAPLALAQDASSNYSPYPNPYKAPQYAMSDCFGSHSKHFVFDYLGLLDPEYTHQIEGAACELYLKTGAQFALVTVPDTGGETLENYAFHLFERWGIGSKERHDGLLLLYVNSYDYANSKSAVRVEAGYGLEGVINGPTAMTAVRAMQDQKQQRTEAGDTPTEATAFALAVGANYLLQTLDASYQDGFPPPPPEESGLDFWFVLRVVLITLAILILLTRTVRP